MGSASQAVKLIPGVQTASFDGYISPRYKLKLQNEPEDTAKLCIGALVLAHSLRDAGTTKKLAVLVTLDSVSAEVITQLKVCLQSYLRHVLERGIG